MSPANTTESDTDSIFRERSFIYIINKRGPKIDPWGTPCFNVIQSGKILLVSLSDFTSSFFLLLIKQNLKQSSDTPRILYLKMI